jgi:ribosomal protein L12E/L44/L45/RPP1/RPP2
MPGYKYPNIDSGATPIGSAGRAPDRKTILRKIRQEEEEEEEEEEEKEEILSLCSTTSIRP